MTVYTLLHYEQVLSSFITSVKSCCESLNDRPHAWFVVECDF